MEFVCVCVCVPALLDNEDLADLMLCSSCVSESLSLEGSPWDSLYLLDTGPYKGILLGPRRGFLGEGGDE